MEIMERKQRDLRQREQLFLDKARALLFRKGYHGLTMDRIAKATGYSRGTIYQHFSCKQEMVIALVIQSMERREAMLERAATFRGRSRECMQAIGVAVELFAQVYFDDTLILHVGNGESIKQKAPEKSLFALKTALHRSMNIVTGIVRDAAAQGDLTLSPEIPPEEVMFNLWAITDGGHSVASRWSPPSELGIENPFDAVMKGCEMICDGYGWRPLSSEWDYEGTRERVRQEIFPEEYRKAVNL